jgi:hypoxanthine phosphoribosyltransferase
VDDVLDTGRTMSCGLAKMRAFKPRRVKTCVLLDKPARRVEKIRADYVGFEIPDVFVVGYGLDWAERYRHLPFIGVLRPHLCR